MNKPSAIPTGLGFYLILLFSFCVSVFPQLSYFLAAGAVVIWVFQILIFRETGFASSLLFYPVTGLAAFSLIVWVLSTIYTNDNPMVCVGLYSLFYFVVFSFVPSREKRKMVIWTFLAGITLAIIIRFLAGLSALPDIYPLDMTLKDQLPTLIIMGFCMIIALFTEAREIRERLFFGLISIPLVIGIMNVDHIITVVSIIILTLTGLLKNRSVLLAVALIAILAFSGLFSIKGELTGHIREGRLTQDLTAPLVNISEHTERLTKVGFFGIQSDVSAEETVQIRDPFFISLIRYAGPPSLLFLIWVIIELTKRDLTKFKKITQREEKAYHFATLLFMAIMIVVNIYGSTLDCSPAVLGLWLFLGMAEL